MIAVSIAGLVVVVWLAVGVPPWLAGVVVVVWLLVELRIAQLERRRRRRALRRRQWSSKYSDEVRNSPGLVGYWKLDDVGVVSNEAGT